MINRQNWFLPVAGLVICFIAFLVLAQTQQKPAGEMSQKQMDEMNMRGDRAMGFDHLKTTHHFLLAKDGGSIQVEANDPKDTESRDQIRSHLRHIAMMFSEGNFEVPMLIHEQNPPGSEVMRKLNKEIIYKFRERERGASIQITTTNAEALQAIHDFLRFQIKEHMTGDSLEVPIASSKP